MPRTRERDEKPGGGHRQSRVDARRATIVLVLAGALLLAGGLVALMLRLTADAGPPAQPRAVIIDQLAFTDPNPDFVKQAAQQLERAGYRVDYFQPQEVTVDFYRDLPKRGYAFVIIRSHATNTLGPADAAGDIASQSARSVGLFTNELYRTDRYLADQYALRVTVDSYPNRAINARFFGITAGFVASSMRGRFKDATVILMGCSGLSPDDLAAAFVSRGVKEFVSWDKLVTAQHTDTATADLLRHLLGERLDLREAVVQTMADVGPDPTYGGKLLAYP